MSLSEEGYYVRKAKDGEEGLNALIDEEFDVVITDLQMPKLDGIKLLKEIQERC